LASALPKSQERRLYFKVLHFCQRRIDGLVLEEVGSSNSYKSVEDLWDSISTSYKERIYVPLPEQSSRRTLLKNLLSVISNALLLLHALRRSKTTYLKTTWIQFRNSQKDTQEMRAYQLM
jgi:hypothetical protein